ncbi:hypothetical protein N7G274_006249 [Stereocaulon virgatum]|uniref:50S ribosomal protein L24 n=1 Tax=Stereocaulon virgatum TaxID=373712 RepID=A0ABR4A7B0_9LECA
MAPPRAPSLTLLRALSPDTFAAKPAAQLYRHRIPPYPYGPALHFTQSDTGLYGGSRIQFGNKISAKYDKKSRRSWYPNIHNKRLWSEALGKFVQVKVQARVLRTIDKVGGLDEYLLGDKPARIKELGLEGWRLRWMVLNSRKVRDRFREERLRLGLPAEGWVEEKESEVVPMGDAGVVEEAEISSGNTVEANERLGGSEVVVTMDDAGAIEKAKRVSRNIVKEIEEEIEEEIKADARGDMKNVQVEDAARRGTEHKAPSIPSKEELEQMGIKMAPTPKPPSGPTREKIEELGVRMMFTDGKTLKTSFKEAWSRLTGRLSKR